MNRKSAATLLLVSLMLCLLASSYLGVAATNGGQHLGASGGQYDNRGISSDLFYRRSWEPSDGNVTLVNILADRSITIGDYGLITVNDTVTVHNNGSGTASSWTFYLPSDVYPKLKYVAARVNGTKSDVVGAPPYSSYIGLRVEFNKVGGLSANTSVVLAIVQQYSGIVRQVNNTQSIAVYFYRYIISPYITMSHNTTVHMPHEKTSVVGIPTEPQFYVGGVVSPFNTSSLGSSSGGGWVFTLPTPVVEVISIDRRVELGSTGYLSTTETFKIKNLGPGNLVNFFFVIPLSVIPETLQAYDSSGLLTSVLDGRNVTVTFRSGLPLQANWTYTYYVSYKTLVDDYKTAEGGFDVIRMESATVTECGVGSEEVVVVFPSHTEVSSIDQFADQVQMQDDKPVVTYTFKNVVPMNGQLIELKYSLDVAQTFERPLLVSLGFFLVGVVYVGARKLGRRGRPVATARDEEKTRELRGLIKEFSSNYEEKTALTLESEQLAEDRRKGRVSKREYIERLNVAKRRIVSLTNVINEEKRKLSLANKRYVAMVKQLGIYEEERENAKASLENLELRRRQGLTTGDVYNRLKYENTRKIDRATAGIDRIIMQFRQETL